MGRAATGALVWVGKPRALALQQNSGTAGSPGETRPGDAPRIPEDLSSQDTLHQAGCGPQGGLWVHNHIHIPCSSCISARIAQQGGTRSEL